MSEKLISDLLDLPEKVRKGDFVLNLSKGITEPDKTLEQYVVTPQLVACFDDALGFTDAVRLTKMGEVFNAFGGDGQVIVLTCNPERYATVADARHVELSA